MGRRYWAKSGDSGGSSSRDGHGPGRPRSEGTAKRRWTEGSRLGIRPVMVAVLPRGPGDEASGRCASLHGGEFRHGPAWARSGRSPGAGDERGTVAPCLRGPQQQERPWHRWAHEQRRACSSSTTERAATADAEAGRPIPSRIATAASTQRVSPPAQRCRLFSRTRYQFRDGRTQKPRPVQRTIFRGLTPPVKDPIGISRDRR